MSSYAMVFKNLEVQSNMVHYDFRTDPLNTKTRKLNPDPFTVTWVNVSLYNATYPLVTQVSSNRWEVRDTIYHPSEGISSPVLLRDSELLSNAFGCTSRLVSLEGLTNKQKAESLHYALVENPQGILVRVTVDSGDNSSGHTLVFMKSNYTSSIASNFENYFIVCDPAASTPTSGDNVTFNKSWTYLNNGTFSRIMNYRIITKKIN